MAHPAPDRPLSVDEYLAREDASPVRHEYVAGEVYALAGETRRHNQVTGNVFARLWSAVRGGPCRVFVEGVKLRAGSVVYYPDVMVACGPEPADPRLEEAPCLVVEVLSPSTRTIDRREKLLVHRAIPSLRAYLIVDQERRRVERHWRDDDGAWQRATIVEAGTVPVPCPAIALSLDEIYEGVTLPPPDARVREDEGAAAYA